ncbi:MAG: hypothetical protein U1E87_10030 [Alphaproteobacteria bacterium]
MKLLCGVAAAALFAAPVVAAPAPVYGALTLTQLGKVLTDERGVPAEMKETGGKQILMIDGAAYQVAPKIQITGILCNAAVSCGGYAMAASLPVPAGAINDAQLLELVGKFDFVTLDRLDATHLALTMAAVTEGGVTAENIDNHLRFFAGQIQGVSGEIQKLVPAQAPAKGKGK